MGQKKNINTNVGKGNLIAPSFSVLRPPRIFGLLILVAFAPEAAAHVKWFAPYDITKSPLPIDQVLTATFLQFFLRIISARPATKLERKIYEES